jgi:hypothetical protein
MKRRGIFLLICVLVAISLLAALASAAIPQTINYQGFLTDSGDAPVNATVSMTFGIYDAPTGGSALWNETQDVTVTNGGFSAVLGSVTPIDLPFDVQYYLGVTVDADAEMTPRQPLVSVPYTFKAATADSMATNSVTGAMIANGTITFDKLADTCIPGQILKRTATGWDCGVPH